MHADSLWRYAFLLGTYAAIVVIIVLMHTGNGLVVHVPWLAGASVPTEAKVGMPVRLRIPKLEIDVPITGVGLTAQGHMDIPKGAWEAGWFNLGSRPGEKGNAVIAGHLDTLLGTPAVFAKLHELTAGDQIVITDDAGHDNHFRVEKGQTYDATTAPLGEIFGTASGRHLQLITCNGAWLAGKGMYEKRFVLFTEFEEQEVSTTADRSDALKRPS